jgi:hypothetical protein
VPWLLDYMAGQATTGGVPLRPGNSEKQGQIKWNFQRRVWEEFGGSDVPQKGVVPRRLGPDGLTVHNSGKSAEELEGLSKEAKKALTLHVLQMQIDGSFDTPEKRPSGSSQCS